MRSGARLFLFLIAAAGPVLLVLLPLSGFVLNSFYSMNGSDIVRSFSAGNYFEFANNQAYVGVLLHTIWLCGRVALICVLLAYPLAWYVWQQPEVHRFPLLLVIILPLFMSYIVKLFTMRSLLAVTGLMNELLLDTGLLAKPTTALMFNENAILLTMVVMYLPFVFLPIYLGLERIPESLVQASADLGGTQATTFRHVVWPLSVPGVVSGAIFAFVLSLGDYVTPQMVGGPNGFTFGRVIFSQFGAAYNWPLGAALAVVLVVVSGAAILSAGLVSKKG
ncbi:ABC transporter permease [Rhizobium mesoamericanum]|uniref:ABC transporter permease n=1 Tax=Rhizobium mesoamericanum TaxID=1079800 RepID=UPI0004069483|nr:ABC transporter permease [Rhizobium mesoamericanum]